MAEAVQSIIDSMIASTQKSVQSEYPYRHWLLKECLPQATLTEVKGLPFEAPELAGISGKRELHNASRSYFDQQHRSEFSVCQEISEAFSHSRLVRHIEKFFDIQLCGSYLRIEFAQDVDGFWLEPHTDLGVKRFTMLLYLSDDPTHSDLGTDMYNNQKEWVTRSSFRSNIALIFVPSDYTYHGFERRPITGIRKSLIINYVTHEWRAREQLAYPDKAIV